MYSHDRNGLENYYGWPYPRKQYHHELESSLCWGVKQNILLCKSFTDVNWAETGVVLNPCLPVQIIEAKFECL